MDIPNYKTMQEVQQATTKDDYLQQLSQNIARGWPKSRNEVPQNIRPYCTFRDDVAVTDNIILKGR